MFTIIINIPFSQFLSKQKIKRKKKKLNFRTNPSNLEFQHSLHKQLLKYSII